MRRSRREKVIKSHKSNVNNCSEPYLTWYSLRIFASAPHPLQPRPQWSKENQHKLQIYQSKRTLALLIFCANIQPMIGNITFVSAKTAAVADFEARLGLNLPLAFPREPLAFTYSRELHLKANV